MKTKPKKRKTPNFYLLAHFQYERDTALIERYRNNGEVKKARELINSQNRFFLYWNKAVNKTALKEAMAKGKPAGYVDKLARIHDKYREFQEVRGYY